MQLCGIDEAGRGALAGPLAIAGVVLCEPIEGVMDSKLLSEAKREVLYEKIIRVAHYECVLIDSVAIDEKGLAACMREGLQTLQERMPHYEYLFDGNTTFGVKGLRTLVKADLSVMQVSAASIIAKVTRDRLMRDYHHLYPYYGFDGHKGYGTKKHFLAVESYGFSPIHRQTFFKSYVQKTLF